MDAEVFAAVLFAVAKVGALSCFVGCYRAITADLADFRKLQGGE